MSEIRQLQGVVNRVAEDTYVLANDVLKLIEQLKKLRAVLEPSFRITTYLVDIDFVAKRLEKLPNWDWGRWLPLDAKYHAVLLEDWEKIIEWDRTNLHKYYQDFFDCDKYAMYFKSNVAWYFGVNTVAVVLDYDAGHAYDLLLPFDKQEPLIYEPQNDKVMRIEDRDKEIYRLGEKYFVLI